MVLIINGQRYTGPTFDYNRGVVIIQSLYTRLDGDPIIQHQLELEQDVQVVLCKILQVLTDTYNYVVTLHLFDRIISITIDGQNADWPALERMTDPASLLA